MTERDDAHLLSGAYALHAVDAEEAEQVEAAMRDSEALREEVVGLSDTAVALGLAVAPEAPPAALRDRVMAAIATTQQSAPAAVPTEMRSAAHVPAKRRRRRRPMAWIAAAAAAVLLFSGGFLLQRTLLEPQTQMTGILQAADLRSAGSPITTGGTATVYWSQSRHQTAVVINDVPVPSDKVLQLWSVDGSTVTSAGLFDPPAGQHFVLITGTPSAGESLAVSVEPDGGSTQPTTKPIVAVPLDS